MVNVPSSRPRLRPTSYDFVFWHWTLVERSEFSPLLSSQAGNAPKYNVYGLVILVLGHLCTQCGSRHPTLRCVLRWRVGKRTLFVFPADGPQTAWLRQGDDIHMLRKCVRNPRQDTSFFIGYGCWVQACHLLLIARNRVLSRDSPDTHWIRMVLGWQVERCMYFFLFLNPIWIQNSHSSDGIYELRLILCRMGAPCSRISQKRPHGYSDAVTKSFTVEINGLHRLLRPNWDIYLASPSQNSSRLLNEYKRRSYNAIVTLLYDLLLLKI